MTASGLVLPGDLIVNGQPVQADEKSLALANAVPIDWYLTSKHEQVERLTLYIYDSRVSKKKAPKFQKIADTLSMVMLNLLWANESDPARFVRYSRDPKRYTRGRYNATHVTWAHLKRIVAALDGDLLEHHIGIPGFDGFDNGKQSRLRATPALIRIIREVFKVSPEMIERADHETIILKGFKPERGERATSVDYRETPLTRQMRANLAEINQWISEAWIDIYLPDRDFQELNLRMGRDQERTPIDFRRTRLRRIFNNRSFEHGGRFYHGWWQEVPREYRSYIQIDNEQTAEIDFSGMHFAIFYAREGRQSPADVYALDGLAAKDREIVKKSLNAMINAKDDTEAARAIRKAAHTLPLPLNYPDAKVLMAAIKARHQRIEHLFCTGEGLRAQFIDAQVAERVMLKLGAKGIVVLPVHDSFLVQHRYVEILRNEMTSAFKDVVEATCQVKAKAPDWASKAGIARPPDKLKFDGRTIESGEYKRYYLSELAWQRRTRAKLAGARAGATKAKAYGNARP